MWQEKYVKYAYEIWPSVCPGFTLPVNQEQNRCRMINEKRNKTKQKCTFFNGTLVNQTVVGLYFKKSSTGTLQNPSCFTWL